MSRWSATRDYLENLPLRVLRALIAPLPESWRAAISGWVGRRVILNTPALRRRIRDNLALIFPDMPQETRDRLLRDNATMIGRNILGMLDNRWLGSVGPAIEIAETEGLRALLAAREQGTGAILVGGHFGRFEAVRAAFNARDIDIAGVYRPQNNPYFNADLVREFNRMGEPMFPRGRAGMRGLIRHLRGGGIAAILIDQKTRLGERLDFMGQPAMTSTDTAELALRLKVPLIPTYALRTGDARHFRIELEPPIPPTDPVTMTQAVNDSLAARVRATPEEYYWLHRRWAEPRSRRKWRDGG